MAKDGVIVYVIPGAGRPGCISNAEDIAINKMGNDSFYFVFKRINSMKLLCNKLKYSVKISNFILDTANLYKFPDAYVGLYPILYKKEKQQFIEVGLLEP